MSRVHIADCHINIVLTRWGHVRWSPTLPLQSGNEVWKALTPKRFVQSLPIALESVLNQTGGVSLDHAETAQSSDICGPTEKCVFVTVGQFLKGEAS